jgi:hypothetical protein
VDRERLERVGGQPWEPRSRPEQHGLLASPDGNYPTGRRVGTREAI